VTKFPKLKSGAVTQYPAERSHSTATEIARFVDGSEQRYRDSIDAGTRWVIELSRLDESELSRVKNFVDAVQGSAEVFEFPDPWGDQSPRICRLESDEFESESVDEFDSRARLIVVSIA